MHPYLRLRAEVSTVLETSYLTEYMCTKVLMSVLVDNAKEIDAPVCDKSASKFTLAQRTHVILILIDCPFVPH